MSSWDSSWNTGVKVKVGDDQLELSMRVEYDTPSYVALMAYVSPEELRKHGYLDADSALVLDSASRENSKIDVREINDSDVYDALFGKLKRLKTYLKDGIPDKKFNRMMLNEGNSLNKQLELKFK